MLLYKSNRAVGICYYSLAKLVFTLANKVNNAFQTSNSQECLFVQVNNPILITQNINLHQKQQVLKNNNEKCIQGKVTSFSKQYWSALALYNDPDFVT